VSRFLILGGNGQLGWELQRSLSPLGEVIAIDRRGMVTFNMPMTDMDSTKPFCGDLGRPDELRGTIRRLKPDVVVNAAAYTAVDRAETEPAVAYAINAVAPGAIALECAEIDCCLIHYSTDYVFDGMGSTPWDEASRPSPLNVYGQTKLEGERQIGASGCRHLVLRTSWLYSARGSNFALRILGLARERSSLSVVADQIGAPTRADLLADITAHAVRVALNDSGASGVYHVAASGETSWYGFASTLIERARLRGWTLGLSEGGLRPIPSSEYATPARRPLNSRLDCRRLERTFGLRMPSWESGAARLLDELAPA